MRRPFKTYPTPWRRIFLWYPIGLNEQWIWLEHVESRKHCLDTPWGEHIYREYRLLEDKE